MPNPRWMYTVGACIAFAGANTHWSGAFALLVGFACWSQVSTTPQPRSWTPHVIIGGILQFFQVFWFYGTWKDFSGQSPLLPFLTLWAMQSWLPILLGITAGILVHHRTLPAGPAWGLTWAAGEALASLQPLPITPSLWGAPLGVYQWTAAFGGRAALTACLVGLATAALQRPTRGLAAAVLLAIPWWIHRTDLGGQPIVIGVLQTSRSPLSARQPSTFVEQEYAIQQLVSRSSADIVVTPEGAWPTPIRQPPQFPGKTVILGGSYQEQNAMLLLAPTTSIAVGKALLVPVAERRWLGLGKDRYRPSSGSRLLPTLNGPAGVLICYEDAYAGPVANGAREGAQWLINASNDGWLGPTHGADLHLAAARLAATETRLWAVRPTTTGHSALIAPDGAIVWQAPWSESGDGFIENGTIYRRKITYSGAMLHPFPSLAAAIILVVWSLKRTKSSTNQQLAGSSSLEG